MEKLHGKPYVDKQGYLRAHDFSTKKCRRVHRMVWEHHNGRKLTAKEHVHHIDGNKQNNAIKNLEIVDQSHHQDLHGRTPAAQVKCHVCGKVRQGREQNFKNYKSDKCSKCKNKSVSRETCRHIVWYWIIWPLGTLLGPYETRPHAVENRPKTRRKSRTLCSFNRHTHVVRSGRKKLSSDVITIIRQEGA